MEEHIFTLIWKEEMELGTTMMDAASSPKTAKSKSFHNLSIWEMFRWLPSLSTSTPSEPSESITNPSKKNLTESPSFQEYKSI